MKRGFLLLNLIILNTLLFGQNTFPLTDKDSPSYYRNMTDNSLLKEGFFKINRSDSIYFWIKKKNIEEFIDYSKCERSTIEKAKHNLKVFLDSTEFLFEAAGNKILYERMHLLNPKNFGYEVTHYPNNNRLIMYKQYKLFPDPWFGLFIPDYLKVRNQFSIKILYLESRGEFIKLACNNEYLTSDFDAKKYIHSIITKNKFSLILWLPRNGSGVEIKSEIINNSIEESINASNSLLFQKAFTAFPDTSDVLCLSYNNEIPKEGKSSLKKPILELYYYNSDSINTIILSNGKGYAAYKFEGIKKIRELINNKFTNSK